MNPLGFGMYLMDCCASDALQQKQDMYEPTRTLSELSPYDHLKRIYRLCDIHQYRRIRQRAVPESVRHLMRSLICISHSSWDDTLDHIRAEGGKAGQGTCILFWPYAWQNLTTSADWLANKERAKFAFSAICWEQSFVPLDVWMSGESHSNVVEAAHANVNREGIQCTIVGGIMKGRHFDILGLATLEVCL